MNDALQAKLGTLPGKPGVYLFKNAWDKVIYVGKALSLRGRVRSYFQDSRGHSPKTLALVAAIADLEVLLTSTELEALILEGNLIKKHKPRYNILLKDDKSFPYLKLTVDEEYPRLLVTRKPHEDKARYYGPFVHASAMRLTSRLIHRHLGIRQCDIEIDRNRPRPCLYYDLHQCDAPCVKWGESKEQYREHVRQAQLLLEGREDSLLDEIRGRMEKAAAEERYEDAVRWRDSLQAVETVRARQRVVLKEPKDVDVVAVAPSPENGGKACIQVFFVRSGKLIDRSTVMLKHQEGADEAELLSSFLPQYYYGGAFVPSEIVVSHPIDDAEVLEEWLGKKRGSKVAVTVPQRGEKLKWVRMVEENAKLMQEAPEEAAVRQGPRIKPEPKAPGRDLKAGLDELKAVFGLPGPPLRIEGFDISHIQGSQTVASMVVMMNGRPASSEYRHYKIKTVEGVDDFASMAEVVGRRYRRVLDEKLPLPDLILIDGGKGQLSAAMKALKELGLDRLPCFGLAKRLEEFYRPGQSAPIQLPERSPGRLMVQRLRDEAHRFAIKFHRNLRSKALRLSALDAVPGVGPQIKRRLLREFGSVEGVMQASDERIAGVKGVGPALVGRIREALRAS